MVPATHVRPKVDLGRLGLSLTHVQTGLVSTYYGPPYPLKWGFGEMVGGSN